ncbi:hypothetical protein BEWA_022290 [Theileria equi strain WA]|uniref:Uncharacterized protein n=1 Tax=Theileria equi strain WA TaxID=1537102 RepID=L0AWJ1_THEEQ|nr:hypothetical protein BEWA_022290 [Theileria equi strain WA]AFZ79381.1 hypothetical protein BEWA_022290 [Theileria equi strain WA]|eukprot:XP_004829047.1 hypothetical protein BEWA_022290 [Theileria equi strain WA]
MSGRGIIIQLSKNKRSPNDEYSSGGKTIKVTGSEFYSDFLKFTHQDKESGGQEPFNLEKIQDVTGRIGIPHDNGKEVTSVSAYYWRHDQSGYTYTASGKVILIGVVTTRGGKNETTYYVRSTGNNNWIKLSGTSTPNQLTGEELEQKLDDLVCQYHNGVTINLTKTHSETISQNSVSGGKNKYCCYYHENLNGGEGKVTVYKQEVRCTQHSGKSQITFYKHYIAGPYLKLAGIEYNQDGRRGKVKMITLDGQTFPFSDVTAVYAFYCTGEAPVLIYLDSNTGTHSAKGWYQRSTGSTRDNTDEQWTKVTDLKGITPDNFSKLECDKYNKLVTTLRELKCDCLKECEEHLIPTPSTSTPAEPPQPSAMIGGETVATGSVLWTAFGSTSGTLAGSAATFFGGWKLYNRYKGDPWVRQI